MKKNYLKILFVALLLCTSGKILRAQCPTPSQPTVSGSTVASCTNSATFTLTGTTTGTNLIGWYGNSIGGNALSTNSVFTSPTVTSGATYYVGQSMAFSYNDSLAMPTYSWNVPAQETRGYYFTAPHDMIITGLRVPVVIGGTVSGIAVVKLPVAPPLYPSITNTFNTLFLNQAITGTNIVSVNIPVYQGDIIGVLGERGGYSAYGPNTANGTFPSTLGVGGSTVNLYRMGMLYNLATTAPLDLWTETVNTIGMVEMYVTRSCNSTLTPVTVTVIPPPQVTITPPPVICANSSYTLSAGGASTYTWSGGPQSPTYVVNPSTTTTYSVQGTILSNCNSTLSTVTISVDAGIPTLTATSSSSAVCSGNTLILNGAGAPTFTWAGGSGTITNNSAFVPAATEQYTLYGSNSCGIGSALITVTVNPTPTLITSSTPAALCDGQTGTLSVTGASTYSWAASTAPGATLAVTPTVSTSYVVSGTSSAGCPANAAYVLIVNPNPTVTIGAVLNKTLVCPGGSATLTSGGAQAYSWSNGSLTSVSIVNPLTTQVYTVTGTYTLTQCSATNTMAINVFSPSISISSNTSVCKGTSITLTANAGPGSTYLWSTGSSFFNTNITATASAGYSVVANTSTVNGLICSGTGSLFITVHPDPTVQIVTSGTVICKGDKIVLTATGGTAFVWTNPASTTASIEVGPSAVNFTTPYSVAVTDVNGCKGSATIGIKAIACTGIDELEKETSLIEVYPNPNSGNFTVRVKSDVQLSLTNELGQVIKVLGFTAENQFQLNIQGLSSGIYFITGIQNGSSIRQKLVVTD
jgi:hypothetical protein